MLLLTSSILLGQNLNEWFFSKYNVKEIVFALPASDIIEMELDEYETMVNKYWKNPMPFKVMIIGDANEYVNSNEGAYLCGVVPKQDINHYQTGYELRILARKGNDPGFDKGGRVDNCTKVHLGYMVTKRDLVYGLKHTQYLLETRAQFKKKWRAPEFAKANANILKE